MTKILTIFLLSFFAILTQGFSDPSHMPTIEGSKDFNRIKTLVGTWEGSSDMGMKGEAKKINIQYKLTSNNSAIVETLFPGTPHEMVSVYHDIKGKLSMKHYCAMGNQPLMELSSSDDNIISLDFSANDIIELISRENIDYIVVDDEVRNSGDFQLNNEEFMKHLKLVYNKEDVQIYSIH